MLSLRTVSSQSQEPFPPRPTRARKPCCVPSGTWQISSRKNRQWESRLPANPVEGCISSATETFPGFTGLQVKKLLERDLGIPVSIDNDVNCAALGEGRLGAATGCPDFLCLTYGTGIGGAIILGGKLHYGQTFAAGEVGHMTLRADGIRCSCGRLGCYEAYASTTALIRRVYLEHKLTLDGRGICELCEQGSEGINETVNRWIGDVCAGLTSCIHMLNPPVVVLGGGIMREPYILGQLERMTAPMVKPSFRGCRGAPAALGNNAGLMGAGYLAANIGSGWHPPRSGRTV